MVSDDIGTEFQSDDEHVESETELGGGEEVAGGIAGGLFRIPGKQYGLKLWSEVAEEAGSKEDTCDHFRDDLWLSEEFCGSADDAAGPEDDCDL